MEEGWGSPLNKWAIAPLICQHVWVGAASAVSQTSRNFLTLKSHPSSLCISYSLSTDVCESHSQHSVFRAPSAIGMDLGCF